MNVLGYSLVWPFALILLPIFLVIWIRTSWKNTLVITFSNVPRSYSVPRFPLNRIPSLLLLSVGVSSILALSRPVKIEYSLDRSQPVLDLIFSLDISFSMDAEDLDDRPRIDVAKEALIHFIDRSQKERLGLVVFSGEAATVLPPTLDWGLLKERVFSLETGLVQQGTAIGDGLAMAIARLKHSKTPSRVVVLMTDGENNSGRIDPKVATEVAKSLGIRVYTIAIGREGPVRIPIKQRTPNGSVVRFYQMHQNALDTALLESISAATGAKSYRVEDPEAMEGVFRDIDSLERSEVKTRSPSIQRELYSWPLSLGMLSLLVLWVLQRLGRKDWR